MKQLFIFFVLCTVISACSDDGTFLCDEENYNEGVVTNDINVTDEGYVNFKTRNAFEDYISKLQDDDVDVPTRASKTFDGRIRNFKSLRDFGKKILTRTSNEDISEEGTEDEYKLSCCRELLPDSRFEYFLDTPIPNPHFDRNKIEDKGNNCYQVSDKVYIYDTFGKISGDTILCKQGGDYESAPNTRASSASYYLGNTETVNNNLYGLSTYKWKTNSWGMLTTLFGIFGTDCSKTNEFDSKHRVKCNLYKVNYGFFKSCGFKVEMQRRKKFLFVKYWVSCQPENLVVGIEEFHSRTSLKVNFNNSPLYIEDRGHYVDRFNHCINNMIYTGYCSYPILTDWAESLLNIETVYAGIRNFDYLNLFEKDPWTYTKKLQKDAVYSGLKSLEKKLYSNKIKNEVKIDAKMALVFNGVGELDNYVRGINAYNGNHKTITFASSGGITFSFGGGKTKISPFNPQDFDLKGIKIFGAAKYGGQWKGIRIYQNE